jgi:hypothetical protein
MVTKKAGTVAGADLDPGAGAKQHVDMYRKVALRRRLLTKAIPGTAAYVPFIGEGDLAVELYADRLVAGADLDPDRVATASKRLPQTAILTSGDCDVWPFPAVPEASQALYGVGDFDAYSYPYDSFRSWWDACPNKARTLVLFFTDGQRQAIIRTGSWHTPEGEKQSGLDLKDRRKLFNTYHRSVIKPWLSTAVTPYKVKTTTAYLRASMIYHGAVVSL